MKKLALLFSVILSALATIAQNDAQIVKQIFDKALTSDIAYNQLKWLCENTEGRICGTPEAAAAVDYTYKEMRKMNLDKVYLQELMVKNWKRGEAEQALILSEEVKIKVPVSALGLSIGTGENGLNGEVIEVYDFEELRKLGRANVEGKIVFFNKPMDPTLINTFRAYGGAAGLRTGGASEAAKYGAIGVVVRSLTLAKDDFPHTGVMRYVDGVKKIPAVMISTNGADLLSKMIQMEKGLEFYFRTTCQTHPDVISHNVIGEIKGAKYPEKIITIGGHLDSWDNGQGAHDDGGGCVQSIEVIRLLQEMNYQPNYTLRVVMFMDEEIAQRGGNKYAEMANKNKEEHVMAIEFDRGVLVPRALAFSNFDLQNSKHQKLISLFKPYNLEVKKGGGGVDIGPLRKYYPHIIFGEVIPDDQRYFDFHHSGNDSFDQVHIRELQLGAAAMASLVYMFDKYGLE